ncbi:hypothetical protein Bbelb_440350 [Branchiostoma belcheri]|nr:hypothetical protein Bbelb_440350 [Branchiostoma belcheri]
MPLDSLVFVNNTRRCVTNSRPSARRASGLNQEDELDTHGCGNQLKISSHIPQHKLSSARSTRGGGCIFTTFGASPVVIVDVMYITCLYTCRYVILSPVPSWILVLGRAGQGRAEGGRWAFRLGMISFRNLHTTTILPSPPRRTSRHPGPERKRCSISPLRKCRVCRIRPGCYPGTRVTLLKVAGLPVQHASFRPCPPADGCGAPDVSLTCFMWRAANLQIGRYPTGPGRKLC